MDLNTALQAVQESPLEQAEKEELVQLIETKGEAILPEIAVLLELKAKNAQLSAELLEMGPDLLDAEMPPELLEDDPKTADNETKANVAAPASTTPPVEPSPASTAPDSSPIPPATPPSSLP